MKVEGSFKTFEPFRWKKKLNFRWKGVKKSMEQLTIARFKDDTWKIANEKASLTMI